MSNSHKNLVLLVHGINTRGLWQNIIRPELESSGFIVSQIGYGKFSIFKFLLPFSRFKRSAEKKVLSNIYAAITIHKPDTVSVISHSFGTYIVSRLLANNPEIKWKKIIFCGSVVSDSFPLEQYLPRFDPPILNEVGTRDFWPAVAESVGWGYGSIGSHGLNHPAVITRWHKGYKHSDFLTKEFARRYWVPFLSDEVIMPGDEPEEIPSVFKFITLFPARYIIPLIMAFLIFTPLRYSYMAYMEASIAGVVKSSSGEPIGGVLINVEGIGRTVSLGDGNFSINLPIFHSSKSYSIELAHEDYNSKKIEVGGSNKSKILVDMDRKSFEIEDLFNIGDDISVTQNIGDPMLILRFVVKHVPKNIVNFKIDYIGVDSDSSSFKLYPVMVQKNNSPFQNQFLAGLLINSEFVGNDFQFAFSNDQFSKWATVQEIVKVHGPTWLVSCYQKGLLEKDIVETLQAYFEGAFIWYPGKYKLKILYSVNNLKGELNRQFEISPESSSRLHAMVDKIERCGGVMLDPQQLGQLSYTDVTARNFIMVTAK